MSRDSSLILMPGNKKSVFLMVVGYCKITNLRHVQQYLFFFKQMTTDQCDEIISPHRRRFFDAWKYTVAYIFL